MKLDEKGQLALGSCRTWSLGTEKVKEIFA